MISIRRASQADADAVATLYRDFFREDSIAAPPETISGNVATMVNDARAGIWVADEHGQIVGLSSATITFGVEFGWACELEDLYVAPSHRGYGLSRKLLNAAIEWAEKCGAREIVLVITPESESEQGLTEFYRNFGFRDSRRITMYRNR